jgi:hypothetical protein
MLRHLQFPRPAFALGLAASFLATREPFSQQPAKQFIGTILGQIERKHYLITLEDQKVVGFLGWGLTSYETAMAWAKAERTPSYQDCLEGDTVLLFSVAASRPEVVRAQRKALKERYPDFRLIGRRVKGGVARPLEVKV